MKTKIKFSLKNDSHGIIELYKTNLCMDVYCKVCGTNSHIDGDSVLFLQCPECETVYELSGYIELIERSPDDVQREIQATEN